MAPVINLIFVLFLMPLSVCSIRILRRPFETDIDQLETLIGTDLILNCTVMLESNDRLYSLKWYRRFGSTYYDEFYSYISSPNETIHQAVMPGITLDTSKTENGEVIRMVNVSRETEGIYRCEAISDELFQVDRKEFNVTVLVPPMEPPQIVAIREKFQMGELVQLRCFGGSTKPRIRWYLAGKQVSDDDGELLEFRLSPEHLTGMKNRFIVRCVSYMDETIRRFYPQHQVEHFVTDDAGLQPGDGETPAPNKPAWWNPVDKPVIEGLPDELQIGDIIHVRCIIPHCPNNLKPWPGNIGGGSRTIQWKINQKKPNPGYIIRHGLYTSELRFKLEPKHLDPSGSLSLGCTSVARFENDQDLIAVLRNDLGHRFSDDGNISESNITNLFFGEILSKKPEIVFKSMGAIILIPVAVVMMAMMAG